MPERLRDTEAAMDVKSPKRGANSPTLRLDGQQLTGIVAELAGLLRGIQIEGIADEYGEYLAEKYSKTDR